MDELFSNAGRIVISKNKAAIGLIQREMKTGFIRACRIMDQLEDAGVVGPEEGMNPRKILMNSAQFEQYLKDYPDGPPERPRTANYAPEEKKVKTFTALVCEKCGGTLKFKGPYWTCESCGTSYIRD